MSRGCNVLHREYSQYYCSNFVWCQTATKLEKCELLSRVWLFVTPQTIALQAPLSVGFPRQEYWSGLPCPPPEKICATQMLMYVKHIPEGTPSPAKWADLLNFPTELHRLPTLEQRKWLSYCSITTIHYLLRICHGCLSTSHILSFSL